MITAAELHQAWRNLPLSRLDDVIGPGNSLVLAPHPDDESLGCGGLIAACCAANRPPVVAILTDGSGSHPASRLYPPQRLADLREHEVRRAVAILGLPPQRLVLLRQPDTRAPSSGPAFDTIVGRLVGFVRDFDCATILAPWQFDPHADHEAAACIASTVATVAGIRLLSYPVWGWTLPDDTPVAQETVAGWRLDVSSHQAIKRQAIMAHASQYGGLIADDPGGFRLPETLLKAVDAPWETFLLS